MLASVRSWSEFTAAVVPINDTDKGTAFEHLVAHYLRTDPIYRAKLVHVWLLSEVPPELYARLRLPARDMGIDLIAETHTGEFWAIQAKFRADTDATIPFGELATFSSLAFHVCAGSFTYALVCTTTARITHTLANLSNLGELTAETWSTLPAEFFASLAAPATTSPPPRPRPRPPRDHQSKAIAAAVNYYAAPGQTRGKLIHPCGSGKSLTAYWIARALDARRVLIAVPSLALVRQTLETWMTEAVADARPVDWLCVCSDDEVADVDNEALVAHVHELGIPCDTDPAKLADHLRVAQVRPDLLVVLTTYQSSPVLATAARDAGTAFDFAVFDEAHKTTGKSSSYYAHLLHDENLPLPRRLFMTATERRFASNRSDDIVSMDDPALYGETIDLLTFKAAIAASDPILCDYRLLTIGVRESEVKALVADNRWLDLGPDGLDEVTSLALASLVALRRATALHGVRHTVSFHSSIARASRFRELCNRLNDHLATESPVTAYHVSGKMGSAARQRELDAFLNTTPSLVTNARCLTEGVDVPGIDCVFFADPKGSTIDIVQASGRALRLDPKSGKKLGYILLPLVVPDGATPEDIAESSAFKFVLFVLRALAAHDERIIEWFRSTAEGRTPETGLVKFDMGEVIPIGMSAEVFAGQIEVRCWERIAKLRWRPFEEARAWARQSGIDKSTDWIRVWKSGGIPRDIPIAPYTAYRGKGWIDWGYFIGIRRPATKKKILPHDEARVHASSLGLTSGDEWRMYARKGIDGKPPMPANIPRNPMQVYRNRGWVNWAHWLGIEQATMGSRNDGADLLPFEEARAFARSLNLSGQRAWRQYCTGKLAHLPPRLAGVPAGPEHYYQGQGWLGYGDWLGTGNVPIRRKSYRPYVSACGFTRSLGLKSHGDWIKYARGQLAGYETMPEDIPRNPNQAYATDGFKWSDWLGVELPHRAPQKSRFRDFISARAFVHELGLQSSTEWARYLKGEFPTKEVRPTDIPRHPANAYGELWNGWGDWLGTGTIAPFEKNFRAFELARDFARTLGLQNGVAWNQWCTVKGNLPPDIPRHPSVVYKGKGFTTWPDFLRPLA